MNPVQEKMIAEMGIGPIWKMRQNPHEKQILPKVLTPSYLLPVLSNPPDVSAKVQIEAALGTESDYSTCQTCGWRSITSKTIVTGQTPGMNYFFIHGNDDNCKITTAPTMTGAANALLNNILRELRIKRGINAHVASLVQTLPSEGVGSRLNRPEGEMLVCLSCVKRQIELIHPAVIISLGNSAAISLLGLEGRTTINDLRGTLYRYAGTPLIVTHELDYLLLHSKEKLSLWSDLCLAMNAIQIQ
jgi:uracil-DNA glycosylase family 4